tara:strand:+ start:3699 stop:3884 length:186 start_codon:yes stop_codon:yes gene_type:complete
MSKYTIEQNNHVFYKNKLLMICDSYNEATLIIEKHKLNKAKIKLEIERENNYNTYYDILGE